MQQMKRQQEVINRIILGKESGAECVTGKLFEKYRVRETESRRINVGTV